MSAASTETSAELDHILVLTINMAESGSRPNVLQGRAELQKILDLLEAGIWAYYSDSNWGQPSNEPATRDTRRQAQKAMTELAITAQRQIVIGRLTYASPWHFQLLIPEIIGSVSAALAAARGFLHLWSTYHSIRIKKAAADNAEAEATVIHEEARLAREYLRQIQVNQLLPPYPPLMTGTLGKISGEFGPSLKHLELFAAIQQVESASLDTEPNETEPAD